MKPTLKFSSTIFVVALFFIAPALCQSTGVAAMDEFLATNSGITQEQTDRKYRDISSGKIPVRVLAVRNLNAPDWPRVLEVEIVNDSSRPVYYVLLVLMFPDIPKSTEFDGVPRGLVSILQYGTREFFLHPDAVARTEDVPIAPGAKVVLKLDESQREGLIHHFVNHNLSQSIIKQVLIRVDTISFGDGSGFRIGGDPFPRRTTSN